MKKLPISFACWDYDRTRALADGTVRPDGIDLTYLSLPVEETFFRMMRSREFDASEMSLSSYTASLNAAEPPFIAIPVFPNRFFRHGAIFINKESGIKEPRDLIGRKAISIWLRASPEVLARRIGRKKNRPLLAGKDPRQVLEELLHAREAAYSQADMIIESAEGPHQATVEAIIGALRQRLEGAA